MAIRVGAAVTVSLPMSGTGLDDSDSGENSELDDAGPGRARVRVPSHKLSESSNPGLSPGLGLGPHQQT